MDERKFRVVGVAGFQQPTEQNRVGTVLNLSRDRVLNHVMSLFGAGADCVYVDPMVDYGGKYEGVAVIRCDGCDEDASKEAARGTLEIWGIAPGTDGVAV